MATKESISSDGSSAEQPVHRRLPVTRLAYLQVGPPQHGICRYGRALAAEGRRRADLVIVEENIALDGRFSRDLRLLRELGRKLSDADLVHIQVSVWGGGTWGRGWYGLANLWTLRRHCGARLVVTLHDVNSLAKVECGGPLRFICRTVSETVKGFLRPGARLLKQLVKGRLSRSQFFNGLWDFSFLHRCALAHAVSRAAILLLVITETERAALQAAGIARNPLRIPHFVENLPQPRPASVPDAQAAMKTVVISGFILPSKGHPLLLEAMQLMHNIRVVFVGGKGVSDSASQQYSQIMTLAREKGVTDRLEVTGYLPDEEFHRRLSMADLAVCPFLEHKSASGSLSTLIAIGCPILATDVPIIAEYNAMVPHAIPTFSPRTAEALAASIGHLLAMPRAELTNRLAELRKCLAIAAIYNQHLEAYRRVLSEQQHGAQGSRQIVSL